MKKIPCFFLAASILCAPISAFASTFTGPTGGDFMTPENWEGGVPAGGDIDIINKGVVFNGTFVSGGRLLLNSGGTAPGSLTVKGGSLTILGDDYGSGNFVGKGQKGASVSLILAGGDLTVDGACAGSIRVLEGSGKAAGFVQIGAGNTLNVAGGNFYCGNDSNNTTTAVTADGVLKIAKNAYFAVAGVKNGKNNTAGIVVNNKGKAVVGDALHLTHGGGKNKATLTVAAGGVVEVGGELSLARVEGAGNEATLAVAGTVNTKDLHLGGPGNIGTLTVENGGEVSVGKSLFINDTNGASTVVLKAGAKFTVKEWAVLGVGGPKGAINFVIEYDPKKPGTIDFGTVGMPGNDPKKYGNIHITVKFSGNAADYAAGSELVLWKGIDPLAVTGGGLKGITVKTDLSGIKGGSVRGALNNKTWSGAPGSRMSFTVLSAAPAQ